MNCIYCGITASQRHHIIKKSEGGNDTNFNKADLCFECHYEIHHGTNIELKRAILKKCYDQIRADPSKCYDGMFKPKTVRLIESGDL